MNPIPVQELRIGNIVMNIENGIRRIISCDMINLRQNHIPRENELGTYWTKERKESVWNDLGYNEAIPLTEDWMMKLGFNNISHDGPRAIFEKENIQLYLVGPPHEMTLWFSCRIEGKEGVFDCMKHYVHELQNFWYSLTTHELTINDNA